MLTPTKKTIVLGDGREITLETGKLAKQADGAVELRFNNTMLLATVVSAKDAEEGADFMPSLLNTRRGILHLDVSLVASPSVKVVPATTKS